jgi:tetratricopeptide (TPR) repeat protein
MIPERIHQYWHSEDLPDRVADSHRALTSLNPEYRAELWSRRTAAAWIERHLGPRVRALFECCAIPAMQSDFFRYCVLLKAGGVYLDSDALLNVPFSRWLDRGVDIALPMTNIGDRERPGLGNGLIACAADSPVLGFALGQCLFNVSRRTGNNIAWVTGPRTLHCALRYARSTRVLLVDPRDGYLGNFELGGAELSGHWSRRQQVESIFTGPDPEPREEGIEALLASMTGRGVSPSARSTIELGWRYAQFESLLREGDAWQAGAAALARVDDAFDFAGLCPVDFDSHDEELKQQRRDRVRRAAANFDRAVEQLAAALVEGREAVDQRSGRPCDSPGLWQQAAVTLDASGQTSLALDCIERAAAGLDYHRGIWLAAARLYCGAGRYADTERFAGEVLQREPRNPRALHYQTRAYEHTGRLDQALACAEELVATAGTENAYALLARIQLGQEQLSGARATLDMARDLFPHSRQLDQLRARIN